MTRANWRVTLHAHSASHPLLFKCCTHPEAISICPLWRTSRRPPVNTSATRSAFAYGFASPRSPTPLRNHLLNRVPPFGKEYPRFGPLCVRLWPSWISFFGSHPYMPLFRLSNPRSDGTSNSELNDVLTVGDNVSRTSVR
jgi:hypothetical protein